MPQIVISVAALIAFIATLIYLHALFKLHAVIAAEKPQWVNRRGSLSFLYSAFPPAANPNIGLAVVRLAFSPKVRELQSPLAIVYSRRIRWCLLLLLMGYGILMLAGFLGEP